MKVGIIDPVGAKAGMDYYDLLLSLGLSENNCEVFLYSNFENTTASIHYRKLFFNIDVGKLSAITSNFTGFYKALVDAKKNKVDWILLHVFRAGLFDLFTFSLVKLMGFKLITIVHDIESLDTLSIPIIRKTVIGVLPDKRVVHNQFSKDQLSKTISASAANTISVVPHVNFTSLFEKYHSNNSLLEALKNNTLVLNNLDSRLGDLVKFNNPIILFFGQIKKVKGLDILIDALPLCKTEVHLVIAGKLRNENWEKYYKQIVNIKSANKVISIIRHITDEERDVLFAISTCIVLPYRVIYQSGVLLMAMSFPLPVIASDLGPNCDIIAHQVNGLLFKSENAANLAQQIDDLVSGKVDATQLKNQAFLDIKNRFSYQEIGRQMATILK